MVHRPLLRFFDTLTSRPKSCPLKFWLPQSSELWPHACMVVVRMQSGETSVRQQLFCTVLMLSILFSSFELKNGGDYLVAAEPASAGSHR